MRCPGALGWRTGSIRRTGRPFPGSSGGSLTKMRCGILGFLYRERRQCRYEEREVCKKETYGGRGPGSRAFMALLSGCGSRTDSRPDRPHRPQPVGEPSDPSGADCLPGNDRGKAGGPVSGGGVSQRAPGLPDGYGTAEPRPGTWTSVWPATPFWRPSARILWLFNLPYLFQSTEAYHGAMEDEKVTGPVFSATRQAGFTAVAWLDAGTRNFYTVKKPVERPE